MKRFSLALFAVLTLALPARADVDIVEVTSPGGITAWLVQEPSIPFMALDIRFRGGASLDALGKRGATNLMTGLLEEGAADMDARAFARVTEALAASFSYSVRDDSLSISARFLTENRDEAVALLRASIKEPRFDQDALTRVRDQVLSGIRSDAQDPNEIATAAWRKMAFGTHPYGSAYEGSVETVSALTREDMIEAHANIFAKDRLYVAAAGDITPEALGAMLDTLLGDLPDTGAPMPEEAQLAISGGVTVIPYPTPQSVAMFGHAGIDQDDDDFFAARVLNQVLGGGSFESRLTQEVRVERGLTYGVYSFLVPRDLAATYQGQVASSNETVAEAIEVIRDEWQKAATEGVTEEEIADAKTYMTGAYPLQFDSNSAISRIMVGMQMLGLPIDYIPTRNERVEAVTVDDVQRVAGYLLDPAGLHFVVVGQPVGLESGPLPN
ncbi:MAG: pitrilysin family protein [Pseudomonadota bacterium]